MFTFILPASSVSSPNLLTRSLSPFIPIYYVRTSSSIFWILTEPPKKYEWISEFNDALGLQVLIEISWYPDLYGSLTKPYPSILCLFQLSTELTCISKWGLTLSNL